MAGTPRTISDELTLLASELEQIEARREAIYVRRLDLWLRGRKLAMSHRAMSVPAHVSKGAVTQALRKHDARNGDRVDA